MYGTEYYDNQLEQSLLAFDDYLDSHQAGAKGQPAPVATPGPMPPSGMLPPAPGQGPGPRSGMGPFQQQPQMSQGELADALNGPGGTNPVKPPPLDVDEIEMSNAGMDPMRAFEMAGGGGGGGNLASRLGHAVGKVGGMAANVYTGGQYGMYRNMLR